MDKICSGSFTTLDGEQFYKIENFDAMEDFFMTITSSSDIWNFCWSQGGITAGRIDCDHAVFPYYTADKVSDAKSYTGSYTAIAVIKDGRLVIWEPFASLAGSAAERAQHDSAVTRNIYKNTAGTRVWFEEENKNLGLVFRYGWTSSAAFGLVRQVCIENRAAAPQTVMMIDGCRNILPACVSADFQNNNSVLLDAYKKTDLDAASNLALFAVSSIVTDKAEPSEGLLANTCWFSTEDRVMLSPSLPEDFVRAAYASFEKSGCLPDASTLTSPTVIKGKRPSCWICRTVNLRAGGADSWYQVFDTSLDACRIAQLKKDIRNRGAVRDALTVDILSGEKLMNDYIAAADGIQHTADTMACVHHSANVMFNIMRGGIFADEGRINTRDFVNFVSQRNKSRTASAEKAASACGKDGELVMQKTLAAAVKKTGDAQLMRLFLEYMPVTFSRRHGDPSRPWNRFSIRLRDEKGNPILNYEGNWRDIFQNWEALAWSYPQYTTNICAKFLNAMTPDGFNPYHISRAGVDWEIPDPDNPWAQIGYWGDHQVIYLQKLLEICSATDRASLVSSLNEKIYTSANIPYRIKSYADIVRNPRSTIEFDRALSTRLQKEAAEKGSDAKLVQGKDGQPALLPLSAKLLQIVIAKAANFVPGGGIWLNTQRPEWNDANNALAGYGLSMVTACYLRRYLSFLIALFTDAGDTSFTMPAEIASCFTGLGRLYASGDADAAASDSRARRAFTDKAGALFEKERTALYAAGYAQGDTTLSAKDVIDALKAINAAIEHTIRINKRSDGLYHAYNTMKISDSAMEVEYLQEMLEGQVAVLSSGMLSPDEALSVIRALRKSSMYEQRQHSYMLYPDKELPMFYSKNCVSASDASQLAGLVERTGTKILAKDCSGVYHFNPDFRNARIMEDIVGKFPENERPSEKENETLCSLYEKTFNHQSFTGRSGTFYAYEGLGSIYWHMVSKLLLAVQENVFAAEKEKAAGRCSTETVKALADAYYDVRSGIGFNKEPALYGAFPADPYSHTPSGQGAKQPGMTGQVKEEVLTRRGELGITVENGIASFRPVLLRRSEFRKDGSLSFTWCGVPVTYRLADEDGIEVNGAKRAGTALTAEETEKLFSRGGSITSISVWTRLEGDLA
jgi:hypothetical protein